jgi:hypothetical protein
VQSGLKIITPLSCLRLAGTAGMTFFIPLQLKLLSNEDVFKDVTIKFG